MFFPSKDLFGSAPNSVAEPAPIFFFSNLIRHPLENTEPDSSAVLYNRMYITCNTCTMYLTYCTIQLKSTIV